MPLFEEIRELGRDLFVSGLISSHGGNISVRTQAHISASSGTSASHAGLSPLSSPENPDSLICELVSTQSFEEEFICITRSGSALGRLREGDVVTVGLATPEADDAEGLAADAQASIELLVHRALYQRLPEARAVVHTHSPYTTLLSLRQDFIEPLDSESKFFLPKVPVLAVEQTIASEEVAALLPELLEQSGCPIAVVRGHGPFAVGKTLDEAWRWVSILEMSSKILVAGAFVY